MNNFFQNKFSNYKGLFISFEGGEGSGKSTQIKLIANSLKSINLEYILTREPGGTSFGEEIRKTLVSGDVKKMDSYSELLCFTAARRQHITEIILPALEDGKIVICDRYVDSTFVYQGYVGGVDNAQILKLHENFCFNLYPDLTILLDIKPSLGLSRKKYSNLNEDRFENQNFIFHERVRKEYINLSKIYSRRFVSIDASLDKNEIFKLIKQKIFKFFNNLS